MPPNILRILWNTKFWAVLFSVVGSAVDGSGAVIEIAREFQAVMQGWQSFLHSEDFCNARGT